MVRLVWVGHDKVLNQRENSMPPLGTTLLHDCSPFHITPSSHHSARGRVLISRHPVLRRRVIAVGSNTIRPAAGASSDIEAELKEGLQHGVSRFREFRDRLRRAVRENAG